MTAQELEQEIERTREHLGGTIDELAGKADMKARARARAAEVKARAGRRCPAGSARARPYRARCCSAAGRSRSRPASSSPDR